MGFWTTYVGPSNQTLTYLLAWDGLATRETIWAAFSTDPEWLEKRAASEAAGAIVERIDNSLLTPTAY